MASGTHYRALWAWLVRPRWFRGAVAALLLIAFGIAIGLRLAPEGRGPAPDQPPAAPTAVAPDRALNLPPLPVEGRPLAPPVADPAPPGPVAVPTLPATPDAPAVGGEGPAQVPAPVVEVIDIVEPQAPTPPPDWRRVQDDMFGGGASGQ